MSRNTAIEALQAAEALCEERGERLTPVRRRVLELVLTSDTPVKAYDLLASLKPGEGSAKPPTVYRALDFLMRLGLVHKVEALNAFVGCTHSHDAGAAELFICTQCGSVQERHSHAHNHDDAEDRHDCCPEGFVIERSVVEHFGRCAACASA